MWQHRKAGPVRGEEAMRVLPSCTGLSPYEKWYLPLHKNTCVPTETPNCSALSSVLLGTEVFIWSEPCEPCWLLGSWVVGNRRTAPTDPPLEGEGEGGRAVWTIYFLLSSLMNLKLFWRIKSINKTNEKKSHLPKSAPQWLCHFALLVLKTLPLALALLLYSVLEGELL